MDNKDLTKMFTKLRMQDKILFIAGIVFMLVSFLDDEKYKKLQDGIKEGLKDLNK